ncbi:gliding motility-associated C-terminal domain-containing protein [Lewinella sp. IMCC34191]|uniref:T9SS type B sorting domain-containing protein n=1 Tax=Lewinella sp. IMCC34191 TaxID=2259172 RepID=UPI0018E584E2|nr:gliding motility-associated C-terminal domain-containing protein [Lewinella sp. IMCC34191]
MTRLYLFLAGSLLAAALGAQPGNDDCGAAIELPTQMSYCSGAGAFTNVAATPSLPFDGYPICIDDRDQMADVWFSFVAMRNSVAIRVIGDEAGDSRGSLKAVQYAIYEGECDTLNDIGCRQPLDRNGLPADGGSIVLNDLQRGTRYYILVGARNGNEGTFELCVDQFDAPPDPSSDCETAVVLCDTTSFSVDLLQGRGNVADDLLVDGLEPGCDPIEENSSWYKWTCDQAGTLMFDINPLGAAPDEDIDFAVYELTNGLEDCSARVPVRQMYSGSNTGDVTSSRPCWGETGLGPADTEVSESCGCQPRNNNFLAALDMEAGKSYALVVLNFSGSGDGFTIDFSGTGTFLGPRPNLTYSSTEVCVGESITFEDQSTSVDGIEAWDWDFGETATPRFATGAGPHEVTFSQAGSPNVTLAITSTRNCIEYISSNEVEVVCCANQFSGSADIGPVSCPGAADGTIDFTASSTIPNTNLTYAWSNGASTAGLTGLDPGLYTVTVSDGTGCEATFDYTVDGPAEFVLDTLITQPTCGGGTDGALQFTILSGGAGGYEYSFNGGPFSPDNRLENLAITNVNVVARDANGCTVERDIEVDELQLALVTGSAVFTEPTCNGDNDGQIEIEIANGLPAYRYDFGTGYQNERSQGGYAAGTYTVSAIDANGCTGDFEISVTEPPVLAVNLQSDSSSCFGANDGYAAVSPAGGRPDYLLSWSNGSVSDSLANLGPGTYTITVTDQNGCAVSDSATLNDPDEILGILDSVENLVCFGQATGAVSLSATGGVPTYTFSSDGQNYQTAPRLDSLLAGELELYVRDQNGCQDTVVALLTEPDEFVITVAEEVQLYLGEDTSLLARSNYFPVEYSWGPDSVTCLTLDCARARIMPVQSIDYFVSGINEAGCVDTALVAFSVIQDLPIYIPNVFSPNGDGSNDFFTVFGNNAIDRVETLRIYDRWGGLLFESNEPFPANEPSMGWDGILDGRRVNSGVYVYYVEVRYINGAVEGYRGDVTVVN